TWHAVGYLLGSVFALNLLLSVFNLLPLPPLDGSGGIMLLLPERVVPKYQRLLRSNPQLGLIGIFIAWQVFDHFFSPAYTFALNVLYLPSGVSYS
ncbi:MAG TPA: hypothetical protein VFY93_18810, partial [Planctomycetota bacterium]|nr:hypothetical protein [Planctomycetota bacterium]